VKSRREVSANRGIAAISPGNRDESRRSLRLVVRFSHHPDVIVRDGKGWLYSGIERTYDRSAQNHTFLPTLLSHFALSSCL